MSRSGGVEHGGFVCTKKGVSKNRGTPKWMVKIMENPIKMDGLGVPLFSKTSIYIYIIHCTLVNEHSWLENGPEVHMYFLLKMGDIPAIAMLGSFVQPPQGSSHLVVLPDEGLGWDRPGFTQNPKNHTHIFRKIPG